MTKEQEQLRTILHIHPAYNEYCGAQEDGINRYCTDYRHVTCPTCQANINNFTLQAGDTFTFNFPRTRFVDENGILKQINKIRDEVEEAAESALTPDNEHTAEEMMDALQALESGLRIEQERYGINLNEVRRRVENKNRHDRGDRGGSYYV